ncbi:MAG: Ca-activated chloride channel [Thermomicrobiales bacterium]|nr:Ca-activated chloride channel [Thermomicrobiales bacterium]
MHRRTLFSLVALFVLAFSLAAPAISRADGVIIVEPPVCTDAGCDVPVNIGDQLQVKTHRVDVVIADQVATTKIDQVFHNPHDWVAQGTYVFPIPEGATIDNFVMYVDNEPVQAKILTAEEARAIYNEIVRKMRDPALLEYVGRGAIQVSVFPIPPGEDRRVQIEYRQVLTADAGLVRYVYPLNTERFSATPLEQVSVHVAVESADPVRAVYSPTHEVAIDRQDDRRFSAGWEASGVKPNTDFELIYTVSADAIGANLLSYWDPAAQEGTFLLLAAPGIAADQAAVAKDVIVVLDTSGSMEGEKIEQARAAVTYVLEHLNSEDRFNIVEFSTGVRIYASGLQPASAAPDAVGWVSRLQATGGTDINRALLEGMAMAQPERPTYVLFLTDGLPTEGEVEIPAILANVRQGAPANVRLFAFGVGDDVDTVLLDTLVQEHHGSSAYVRPGERLDEAVSTFYARVSTPLLTDVTLQVDGVTVEEVYPQPLPDIFAGTQLVVVGKYRTGGPAKLVLTGNVNGQTRTYVYEDRTFQTSSGDEFLPRLWATRKIGYLLNQIRLHGENAEWIQAIVDLSVRYGIVTPYTSYLITEEDILTDEGRAAAAQAAATATAGPSSGGEAVDEAEAVKALASSNNAAPAPEGDGDGSGGAVRIVGNRTFLLQDGVWIETTFNPSTMTTIKVQFAGDDYFKLLDLRPDLAGAFSLGDRVIAISNGTAFEVTPEEQPPIDFSSLGG